MDSISCSVEGLTRGGGGKGCCQLGHEMPGTSLSSLLGNIYTSSSAWKDLDGSCFKRQGPSRVISLIIFQPSSVKSCIWVQSKK